jgi:hypothetical protein
MPTITSSQRTLKAWFQCGAVLLGAVALAGCVVTSVYPYYTAKEVTFDDGLTGRWTKPGETNVYWTFDRDADRAYFVTAVDEHETNCFNGYLFQLKGQPFLDLCTTNRDDWRQLPLHLVVKVERTSDQLHLAVLNSGWLGKLLEAHPKTLRHMVVPEKPLGTNGSKEFYLTAETPDLQKFLLKYRNDTNAFDALNELKRANSN